ncbi:MAG: fatty acid desaturase [Acidobacteria bacterium]|nr:fatty acid desaturase [Acidobacteriota bacterium]
MSHPRIRPAAAIGFGLVHVAALGILVLDFTWWGVALCVASYYLRMFAITAGFHRYFSHRTYQLGRVSQFLMAFLGQTAAQKGVLWWAAHHRHHHRYSDMPEDIHSPKQRGFWWSHMGWILAEDYEKADYARIPDFAKYPELRWLDSNQFLATMVYALFMFFAFGWTGLFYGYFLATVLLWHGTFTINSVMHVFGRRVYATKDDSRNSMIFALVTMGEGWHNNHHHYPGSAAQGFHWWQIDPSYYLLWIGEKVGLVKGLRRVPEKIKVAGLRAFDEAIDAASKNVHDRLDQLTARWEELRANARASAHHAIEDLEAKRVRASERLEALQADYAAAYAAAKSRAGAAADEKVAKLRKDIEEARAQLAELLARLIEAAEAALSVPSGLPA